ncbi:protein SRC2-like [Diospyros lotus]|uniref:protein SRC2-like n=1 Tax=Diospyros lotus TaxID=55363 RepID=UPI0022531A21|nr:protein SRC2-like [Diospyros lotus]
MTHKTLDITVTSADVLKNANFFTRMRVYTVVCLVDATVSRQTTPVDENGGARPFWNCPMRFQVEEAKLHQNSAMLVFQLRSHGRFRDTDIGSLYVPIKELFDGACDVKFHRQVALAVSSRSGKPKGVLYLSCVLGSANSGEDATGRPLPSAPYPPEDGCFRADPAPSAPYIREGSEIFLQILMGD